MATTRAVITRAAITRVVAVAGHTRRRTLGAVAATTAPTTAHLTRVGTAELHPPIRAGVCTATELHPPNRAGVRTATELHPPNSAGVRPATELHLLNRAGVRPATERIASRGAAAVAMADADAGADAVAVAAVTITHSLHHLRTCGHNMRAISCKQLGVSGGSSFPLQARRTLRRAGIRPAP